MKRRLALLIFCQIALSFTACDPELSEFDPALPPARVPDVFAETESDFRSDVVATDIGSTEDTTPNVDMQILDTKPSADAANDVQTDLQPPSDLNVDDGVQNDTETDIPTPPCDWATGACWLRGFKSRVRISLAGGLAESLTDFPVLVDVDLKYEGASDGRDLRFVNENGELLDFEIERITKSHVTAWVRLPFIDASTKRIELYFDPVAPAPFTNLNGVWINGFAMVLHMNPANNVVIDSVAGTSSFGTVGQLGAQNGDDQSAIIGHAAAFDLNAYTLFPAANLPQTRRPTLVARVRLDSHTSRFPHILGGGGGNGRVWQMFAFRPSDGEAWTCRFEVGGSNTSISAAVNTLGWHVLTCSASAEGRQLFLNGELNSSRPAIAADAPDGPLSIGANPDLGSDREFHGLIDEIRVSHVQRSGVWLQAEQADLLGTFASPGPIETR